jgi:hypothetical protein
MGDFTGMDGGRKAIGHEWAEAQAYSRTGLKMEMAA